MTASRRTRAMLLPCPRRSMDATATADGCVASSPSHMADWPLGLSGGNAARSGPADAPQLRSLEGLRGSGQGYPIRSRAGRGRRPTSGAGHGARSASHDLGAAFTTTPSRTPFSRISSNTTLCLSVGSLEGICIATLSTPSSFGVSRSLSSSD